MSVYLCEFMYIINLFRDKEGIRFIGIDICELNDICLYVLNNSCFDVLLIMFLDCKVFGRF